MQTSNFLSFYPTNQDHYSFVDASPIHNLPQPQFLNTTHGFGSLDFELSSSQWYQKDPNSDVSRVLLFKGLPDDITEAEFLSFCQPFGIVKDILLKRQNKCAFLQFERLDQAQNCCENFTKITPAIRGHYIYVCYNGTDKISKPSNTGAPSRYLLVAFNQAGFSLDSNLIAQILAPYGRYLRVVMNPTKTNQAYIEMEDVYQAIHVKEALDGECVYNMGHINIYYADEQDILAQQRRLSNGGLSTANTLSGTLDHLSPTFSLGRSNQASFGSLWNEQHNQNNCAWPTKPQNEFKLTATKVSHFNSEPKINRTSMNNLDVPMAVRNDSMPSKSMNITSPLSHVKEAKAPTILLLKNLPRGLKAKQLFRLFGMYGNVLKVKIFFKSPENALIEYQTSEQAELAKTYLNNCPVYGNNMFVTNSKVGINIDTSALKKSEDSQFTGDYTNSPEHRYKFHGSKNHLNIAAPSKVIHLSNLCDDKDESFYADLFADLGTINRFMFMKGAERMALMEMSNIEEAVKVLANFHNFNINGKYLKVSFSKYNKVKDI